MSGLFPYFVAGLGFLLISSLESLHLSSSSSSSSSRFLPLRLRFVSSAALASLFVLSSLLSSLSSLHDPLGPSLPLSSLSASSLFLLYSLSGLLSLPPAPLLPLPSSLLDLLALFAFALELLLFLLRRKDLDGVENRYFDLLLAPVLVCAVSTALLVARPRAVPPRLARAAGLALQGTWFLQMGFSFFTSAIAHGCELQARSRANYTIRCKTHEEYHRARAIATLQFNCHIALLLLVGVGIYAAIVGRRGSGGVSGYSPLNKELQMGDVPSNFTLDLDDDDDEDEIRAEAEAEAEANRTKAQDVTLHAVEPNGFGNPSSRD